jgi:ankyrin repeat protein
MFEDDLLEPQDLNLIELALRLRWSTAAARASRNPKEIEQQDDDGLTVLHWACCNHPPLRFLRELRVQEDFFSRAASIRDMNGMTPLLCACACQASTEIILLLIEACPESALLTDNEGWTALHYLACSSQTMEGTLEHVKFLSKKLLSLYPTLASARDSRQLTPLQALCDTYQRELKRFYYSTNPVLEGEILVLWDIIHTLVHSSADSSASMLHRLVSLPQCPIELVMVASRINPVQLIQQDSNGDTPLHLTVASGSHFLSIFLLQKDPTAAGLRNDKGETPLCVARRTLGSWATIHGLLLHAHASAIELIDLHDALYPTILGRTTDCVTTTFEIVRANPARLTRQEVNESKWRSSLQATVR